MEKQERALQAWLNSRLSVAPKTGNGLELPALAARRMAAQVEGLLWQLYSQDQQLVAAMLKVEARIDAGRLRLRDEVSSRSTSCGRPALMGTLDSLTLVKGFHPHWSRALPLMRCMASLAAFISASVTRPAVASMAWCLPIRGVTSCYAGCAAARCAVCEVSGDSAEVLPAVLAAAWPRGGT